MRPVKPATKTYTMTLASLEADGKKLNGVLAQLQKMIADLPWADFSAVCDQIGARRDELQNELIGRKAKTLR